VTLNRIACPECGAGLKSPNGFTPGQTVSCPKCETDFRVEESADEQPKKKKGKNDEDGDWSYKNSWIRYAVLGGLLVTLGALGFMLYEKRQRDSKDSGQTDPDSQEPLNPKVVGGGPRLQPMIPGMGAAVPDPAKRPDGGQPGRPEVPKGPAPVPAGGGNDLLGGLLGGPALSPAETDMLTKKYQAQIVGTWKADLGGGTTVELVYGADGKVAQTVNSPNGGQGMSSQWSATGLVGRKGLVVVWTGNSGKTRPEPVVFEDDEMQHPVMGQPGVIGVFRKK